MLLGKPLQRRAGQLAGDEDARHRRVSSRLLSEPRPQLSVVVVTFNSSAAIEHSLPAIVAELRDGDDLIVADNASSDGTPARARELAPGAAVVELERNGGFGLACNAGAAAASGELLLFLNPDAVVAPGFRDAIELPLRESRGWDAWQGLVTAEGGAVVNTWGGVVHFTGIGWAGGAGRPLAEAPPQPREIPYGSGACLAVRRPAWEAVGGFGEHFFLYHEDTDLGLRLWLGGHRVGLEPRARCEHDYEFAKGGHKWYFLERNRYATLIRTYPSRLLWAVLPALVAAEPALLLVAVRGGWLREKLRAWVDTVAALPRLRRERAAIQRSATRSAGELAGLLTAELDSEYLGGVARWPPLRAALRLYWRLARRLAADR